ncbi:hypothetical protein ACFW2V_13315 [Streptomyces sp. NPDC058947]|uniref:hypothetical protein n=1 Tax=Streptomyces sp. NPDC058947 TaxID=3346675 RepID=UPI0036C118D1
MMGVGIKFIGGPADGRLTFIPEDPMDPPLLHELLMVSGRKAMYERQVNPGDQGPLWLYRYIAEAEEG